VDDDESFAADCDDDDDDMDFVFSPPPLPLRDVNGVIFLTTPTRE
jgi:hypothetical protein